MKRFVLPLLFILSSSPVVRAGLGEAEIQLAERYGQPLFTKPGPFPNSTWRRYTFQGITIDVESFDGVSQREQFRKPDGKFSVDEVKAMLKASVLKGEWEKLEKLDEPDADGSVEQQGASLRQGKEIIADASVSTAYVSIQTREFFFKRTRMYPGGNIP